MSKPRRSSCPICGAPPVAEHQPFCSRGCRDRDLLTWLDGGYQLPGRLVELDDDGAPIEPPC